MGSSAWTPVDETASAWTPVAEPKKAPDSFFGGIGRRAVNAVKGVGALLDPTPNLENGELGATAGMPGALPIYRLLKGQYDGSKEALHQAVDQLHSAMNTPTSAVGVVGKAAMYARPVVTALSAADPFATGSVTNVNQLSDQGRMGEAAGQGTADALMLGAPKIAQGAGAVVSKVAPQLAEKMYASALKPSTTIPAAQRSTILQTGLNNSIPISEAGAAKLSGLIDDLNDKIKTQIASAGPKPWPQPIPGQKALPAAPSEITIPASAEAASQTSFEAGRTVVRDPATGQMKRMYTSSTAQPVPETPQSYQGVLQRPATPGPKAPAMQPGATINPAEVVKRLDDIKSKFANQVNPEGDLAAIDAAKQEFLRNNPNAIPVGDAQAMKQGTYQQLKARAYGQLGSGTIEAQKALARGIKEELQTQFPEIGDLNAQEAKFMGLDSVLEKAINRIGNHQLIGIGTPIVGGAAGAAAGGPAALASMVLKATLDDPIVKSRLAIILNKAGRGKIPMSDAMSRVANYSAALGQGQANNQPQQ